MPQFNLKTLLIAVTMAAVVVTLGNVVFRRRASQRATEWAPFNQPSVEVTIEPISESPYRSYDGPGIETRTPKPDQAEATTERLALFLDGDEQLLARVRQLNLADAMFDPATLDRVARLQQLEHLTLRRCSLPIDALNRLAAAPRLHWLELEDCEVDVTILQQLPILPKLTRLTLAESRLTRPAVDALAKLTRLERLDLRSEMLSVESLDYLKRRLPRCDVVTD